MKQLIKLLFCSNYPNPFNPTTTITYSLPKKSFVKLSIYDLLGREITTLVNEETHSGTHQVTWNAQNVPSGIYFYNITPGNYSKTNKMIFLK
jgi:flagellar hook assembly protein FlgD